MAQNLKIVIIDSDVDSVTRINNYIDELADHVVVEGVANTFEKGFELIHKVNPAVVIMEIGADLDKAIGEVSAILEHNPQTSLFMTSEDKSSDTILKFMRAGATEYILRPVSREDLESSLQKVGRLWIAKPAEGAEEGSIYTFFSPKGGIGVTTLAVNFAVMAHKLTKKPTLLVDLDLNAGDVTTFLDINCDYTIGDVTVNMNRLDESFLKGVIAKHDSGVYVLAEPRKVEDGVSISGDDLKKVLPLLKTMFSNIIIDTENILDDRTLTAINMTDRLFLLIAMSITSIKHTHRHLEYFKQHGIDNDKIDIIANRFLDKGDITIKDAEEALNHHVSFEIPNDYDVANSALNKGVPIETYKHRSKLTSALDAFTKKVLDIK